MLYVIIAVLVVLMVIVACFFLSWRKKSKFASVLKTEKMDIVTLKDVISFFKQPEVLTLLKKSEDHIAVAIREKQKSGGYQLVLCIFSKEKSSIIQSLRLINTPILDADLLSLFGEKDMLVLQ